MNDIGFEVNNMKKWIIIMLLLLSMLCIAVTASADVAIDETNFPDDNFRSYVTQFDTNGDGVFSDEELGRVKSISCDSMNIADMTGIEYFTFLTDLGCVDNQLTELDLSSNTELTYLNCWYNQLTYLNVSNNSAITYLDCSSNQLIDLDVSNMTELYIH